MQQRKLGSLSVSAIGLGCMNLSHAYGTPPDPETSKRVLLDALELGCNFYDTAAFYGFGANEILLGEVLKPHRNRIVLASKCGMIRNDAGVREIDSRPEALRKTCDKALRQLQTDVIDLYYLHRWDKKTPIEEAIGGMADLIKAGKVRAIGLSEVSAATLRKAHAAHPITAIQSEYSLWSRNPELGVLDACKELGIGFVAFSPLARGFLTGGLRDVSTLPAKDIRVNMPRFAPDNYAKNLKLLDGYMQIAREADCTPAQLALAWVMARWDGIVPIPGTTRLDHLADDLGAANVRLSQSTIEKLDALINRQTVTGARYPASAQVEIDTEGD